MTTPQAEKFAHYRSLFPHTPDLVYFNSASYCPFCTPVTEAIEQNLRLRTEAREDDSLLIDQTQEALREDYAGLIGARKREVGLAVNTTQGLNIAAFGVPLSAGDEVLISDIEFPAIAYTWRAAAEAKGFKLKFVPSTNRCFDIEELKDSMTKSTRVLALSQVQYFNGFKNNLRLIAELCKDRNIIFVVDGIQGMGVEPINVRELGIDIFSSGCQKWMLSPQGCGFFYISDKIRDSLSHPFMSWLGADWNTTFTDLLRYDLPWFDTARRFEMGYYVSLNVFGMKAAVEIFKDLGISEIQQHNYALIDQLARFVNDDPYYRITSSMDPDHRSSIFTFTCDHLDALRERLADEQIILVKREGSIRVSVHLFNNEQDIDRLTGVLKDFARLHGG